MAMSPKFRRRKFIGNASSPERQYWKFPPATGDGHNFRPRLHCVFRRWRHNRHTAPSLLYLPRQWHYHVSFRTIKRSGDGEDDVFRAEFHRRNAQIGINRPECPLSRIPSLANRPRCCTFSPSSRHVGVFATSWKLALICRALCRTNKTRWSWLRQCVEMGKLCGYPTWQVFEINCFIFK